MIDVRGYLFNYQVIIELFYLYSSLTFKFIDHSFNNICGVII